MTDEQRKLRATYLNNCGTAILAVGGLAPMVSILVGAVALWPAVLLVRVCLGVSLALHFAGLRVLGRLGK